MNEYIIYIRKFNYTYDMFGERNLDDIRLEKFDIYTADSVPEMVYWLDRNFGSDYLSKINEYSPEKEIIKPGIYINVTKNGYPVDFYNYGVKYRFSPMHRDYVYTCCGFRPKLCNTRYRSFNHRNWMQTRNVKHPIYAEVSESKLVCDVEDSYEYIPNPENQIKKRIPRSYKKYWAGELSHYRSKKSKCWKNQKIRKQYEKNKRN